MASVACPLVCGVSKNAHRKKANGTADRQNTNRRPKIVPKLALLNNPPVVNKVHKNESTNPVITPSDIK
jgi:hypothetical protein